MLLTKAVLLVLVVYLGQGVSAAQLDVEDNMEMLALMKKIEMLNEMMRKYDMMEQGLDSPSINQDLEPSLEEEELPLSPPRIVDLPSPALPPAPHRASPLVHKSAPAVHARPPAQAPPPAKAPPLELAHARVQPPQAPRTSRLYSSRTRPSGYMPRSWGGTLPPMRYLTPRKTEKPTTEAYKIPEGYIRLKQGFAGINGELMTGPKYGPPPATTLAPFTFPSRATARQSVSQAGPDVAQRAIDGNRDANHYKHRCTTTSLRDTEPWWEVDFGEKMTVNTVWLFNRGDCCSEFMRDLTITVDGELCNKFEGPAPSGYDAQPAVILDCIQPLTGQTLKITKKGRDLMLCEVEWY